MILDNLHIFSSDRFLARRRTAPKLDGGVQTAKLSITELEDCFAGRGPMLHNLYYIVCKKTAIFARGGSFIRSLEVSLPQADCFVSLRAWYWVLERIVQLNSVVLCHGKVANRMPRRRATRSREEPPFLKRLFPLLF
jgi:hypothetical protein